MDARLTAVEGGLTIVGIGLPKVDPALTNAETALPNAELPSSRVDPTSMAVGYSPANVATAQTAGGAPRANVKVPLAMVATGLFNAPTADAGAAGSRIQDAV